MKPTDSPNGGLALPEHVAAELEAAQAQAFAQAQHEEEMIAAARAMHFDMRGQIYASMVAVEADSIDDLKDDEMITRCIAFAEEAAWRYIEVGVPALGIRRGPKPDTELSEEF